MPSTDIECPRCRGTFAVLATNLVAGQILACPSCGLEIVITEQDLQTLRESSVRVESEEV